MNEIKNISGKDIARNFSRKLSLVFGFMVVPPADFRAFDTVSPVPDYIEANPKQSLPLTTCLNAPLCPITDNGRLADTKSRDRRQIRNLIEANRTSERLK